MNDLEEDLDQNTFGITYLKNVVDNLNTTDIQQKITKVEATMKMLNNKMQKQFDYWTRRCKSNLIIGNHWENWLPLIQANEYAIKELKSKTENLISPNICDSSQSINFILNWYVTDTNQGNVKVPYMTAQHLALSDSV